MWKKLSKGRKMASKSALPLVILSVLILVFTTALSEDGGVECGYLIYVQTGTVKRAGTHSTISLEVKTASGEGISVPNLEEWGTIMGPNYNFFETGRLDTFTGRGPCLTSPVCSLNLTSNGSGPYHAWYCEYVEVTASAPGRPCQKQRFSVDQWLASDQEPYSLTASVDYCGARPLNANGNQRRPRFKSAWASAA